VSGDKASQRPDDFGLLTKSQNSLVIQPSMPAMPETVKNWFGKRDRTSAPIQSGVCSDTTITCEGSIVNQFKMSDCVSKYCRISCRASENGLKSITKQRREPPKIG